MIPTREEFDADLYNHRFNVLSHARHFKSPIEWEGHWFVQKVLKAKGELPAEPLMMSDGPIYPPLALQAVQVPLPTKLGNFYGDAVVHTPGKNTLIEYDGRAYHQDQEADDARSAAILETGLIDQIVRIPAVVLHERPGQAAYIVSRIHPEAAGTAGLEIANLHGNGNCRTAWEAQRPSATEPLLFRYDLPRYDDLGDLQETLPISIWIHRPTRQGDRVSRMLALLDHYYIRSPQELIKLYRQHHPGTGRT